MFTANSTKAGINNDLITTHPIYDRHLTSSLIRTQPKMSVVRRPRRQSRLARFTHTRPSSTTHASYPTSGWSGTRSRSTRDPGARILQTLRIKRSMRARFNMEAIYLAAQQKEYCGQGVGPQPSSSSRGCSNYLFTASGETFKGME